MGKRRYEVLVVHREAIREIAKRNRATWIALTGSVARGDDHENSDFDFVCSWEEGISLLDMGGLQFELSELLGAHVDIATAKMLKGNARSMLDDAITI